MEGITLRLLSLLFLLFLVFYRTIATVFPERNIMLHVRGPQDDIFGYVYHGEIESSDVACVVIWILVTLISTSLVWDIRKRLVQSVFKDFYKILSLLSIILYEVWMFGYIYSTYATNFDWSFKIIILLPLVTLLVHSIFQTFLSYDDYASPKNKEETEDLLNYIVVSLGFNGIMTLHVICMFITALSTGTSKEENLMCNINVFFLGLGEMMNRVYIMKNHIKLFKNHCIPHTIYERATAESHGARVARELVTGLT